MHEQVEAGQWKEEVLDARLGPLRDEAYVISTSIEAKLAGLQMTKHKVKEDSADQK